MYKLAGGSGAERGKKKEAEGRLNLSLALSRNMGLYKSSPL
jgi:hypothetical protein